MKVMFSIFNGKKAAQYIFFEMLPSFLMGVLVFVSIILMFQILRLTDFALVHGVDLKTIFTIVSYVVISMLPVLLPMSLLFAILLTYGRLSQDSEIVAMKASGLHMATILTPAILLATVIAIFSAQTSFNIAPWGNRQFEVLYSRIGSSKAGVALKEGTFAEGFFDKVVYAGKVNSEKGLLEKVFIYDESSSNVPLTIIAKRGQIVTEGEFGQQKVMLRLEDGNIHRQTTTHTKIQFNTYDIQLNTEGPITDREKSLQSLSLQEIQEKRQDPQLKPEEALRLTSEYHKRWAISVLCLVFAMIGVGLGTTTNKRAAKAGGMILCIGIIVVYWIMYVAAEGLARSGEVPVALAIWSPNILFGLFGIESLRRNWN